MATQLEIALELAEEIKKINMQEDNRIPTSDSFLKDMIAFFSRDVHEIRQTLEMLREAKYIFIIKIVLPEQSKNARDQDQGVDAYIYADLKIVNELKGFAEKNWRRPTRQLTIKENLPSRSLENYFPRSKNIITLLWEGLSILR